MPAPSYCGQKGFPSSKEAEASSCRTLPFSALLDLDVLVLCVYSTNTYVHRILF